MTGWRFHQLRDYPRAGVLIGPDGKAAAAEFYSAAALREKARAKKAKAMFESAAR